MSAFRPDQKDLAFEEKLQAHPLYQAQLEPIRTWLGGFRTASSPQDYYHLHRDLLNWFFECQRFEEERRAKKKELAGKVKAAVEAGAAKEKLRALSEEISIVELDRKVAVSVLAVYRDFADGLVWRLFGYRRPVLAALGEGKVVGRLSDEGLDAELHEIQGLWERDGIFALHADITTCVRHGDVIAFDSIDPLQIYISESKRSGRFDSNSKQGRRLRVLQELIERGAHSEAADGKSLEFSRPGIAYATYHDVLGEMVTAARRSTYASREIDSGLAMQVWDEANPAGLSPEEAADRHGTFLAELGWTEEIETITVSASLRRLRGRRLDHNFPSLAPLSLAPLPLDDATDLLLGRIDFITTLHLPSVEARLSKAGIEATICRGDDAADSFLRAERDGVALRVPPHAREQIQIELMKLGTFVDVVDWLLGDLRRRGTPRPNVSLFYEDERKVWEAPVTRE